MVTKAFSIEDGNLATRSLVTTRKRVYKDIDLTFDNRPSGDVYKKEDAAAVKQAVKNLLLTNYNEKPFQPLFGANLRDLLFELADDQLDDSIDIAIRNAIQTYEPRAKVKNIRTRVLPDNNSVSVYVEFLVINTAEEVTLEVVITRLR